MQQTTKQNYEFGSFRLDPLQRVLLKDGKPVQLTPKAFDTLLALVEHSGEVLGKDELMQRVWPDTFVEESNLTVYIHALRKALGEGPNQNRYIVTIPGRGYRFVASVRGLLDEGADLILKEHARTHVVIEEERQTRSLEQTLPATDAVLRRLHLNWKVVAVCAVLLVMVTAVAVRKLMFKTPAPTVGVPLLQTVQLASWKTEPGAPATVPCFSRDGKMIAFSSTKSGHSNIWIKQVMGGDQIQITRGDCIDLTPIWSPDDQQIAFISNRGGQEGIWLSLSHGSTPTLLKPMENAAAAHLRYWSKDGKTIYYEQVDNLYALDIDSKLASQLTHFDSAQAFTRDFAISPDENWMAYSHSKDGQSDIWAMPLHGGTPRQVTHDAYKDLYPTWYPDEQRIIYSSNRGGAFQICAVPLDGGEPEQLTFTGNDSVTPSVSPDGTRIIFHVIKEEADLWGVRTDSGEEFEVTSEVGLEVWPDASPDGKAIVFQAVGGSERFCNGAILVRAPSTDSRELQLADNGFDAHWSPDGAKVAFMRFSEGKFSLWTINASGGEARLLTPDGLIPPSFGQLPLNRVSDGGYSWSPDSSKMAYGASLANQNDLWTVSADGAIRSKISDNPDPAAMFTRPLWSRDGTRIASVLAPCYFSANRRDEWSVWISGLGSIFRYPYCLGLIGWSASGDSLIVASTESRDGLRLADINLFQVSVTGSRRDIAQLKLAYPDNLELSPDGKVVAFVSRQDGRDNVWVIPTSGGSAHQLTRNTDPRLFLSAMTWSPDGKAIYYSKQTRSSQVSIIENFR